MFSRRIVLTADKGVFLFALSFGRIYSAVLAIDLFSQMPKCVHSFLVPNGMLRWMTRELRNNRPPFVKVDARNCAIIAIHFVRGKTSGTGGGRGIMKEWLSGVYVYTLPT